MIGRAARRTAAALAVAGAGCATVPGAGGAAPDRTGGRTIEMIVRQDSGSLARYRVETDGTLRFAGGADVAAGEFSWSGPLTAEEIERLLALVERGGWQSRTPPDAVAPGPRTYEVSVRGGGGRGAFEVAGEAPTVTAAYDLLQTAARRRLDPFLQRLPKPGLQH